MLGAFSEGRSVTSVDPTRVLSRPHKWMTLAESVGRRLDGPGWTRRTRTVGLRFQGTAGSVSRSIWRERGTVGCGPSGKADWLPTGDRSSSYLCDLGGAGCAVALQVAVQHRHK